MSVTIDIPKAIEDQLRTVWGDDLSRAVKEALAVEGYRAEKLSLGQVAELLGLTVYEADGFLKQRGVPLPYSVEDLDADVAALQKALPG
jgi:predicted HTH domain antitoxin